jgi:hypothetical protein
MEMHHGNDITDPIHTITAGQFPDLPVLSQMGLWALGLSVASARDFAGTSDD